MIPGIMAVDRIWIRKSVDEEVMPIITRKS